MSLPQFDRSWPRPSGSPLPRPAALPAREIRECRRRPNSRSEDLTSYTSNSLLPLDIAYPNVHFERQASGTENRVNGAAATTAERLGVDIWTRRDAFFAPNKGLRRGSTCACAA